MIDKKHKEVNWEVLIVLLIIILFTFLSSLTYIAGKLHTPADHVFLGTVHWVGDYFYYLSQFAQGRQSWFSGYDLFTSDFPQETWVGWVNVFLGKVFYLLGINHLLAYQLSIVIFTAAFLAVSYLLIREIFPDTRPIGQTGPIKSKWKRIAAFILFAASNAFPKIAYEGGKWIVTYYDFWFNTGAVFNRLVGVPHQMVGRTAVSLSLLLALIWWRKRDRKILLILPIIGFILTSVEPVHWLLVGLALIITPIFSYFISFINSATFFGRPKESGAKKGRPSGSLLDFLTSGITGDPRLRGKPFPHVCHSVRKSTQTFQWESLNCENAPRANNSIDNYQLTINNITFLPTLFFFLGGLPMALYLKKMFSAPPYSQLAFWENSQQLHINFLDFILGNGPVAVLAIFGLIIWIKKLLLTKWPTWSNLSKWLGVVFSIITIFLYFSPIPQWLGIVNVRFLPVTTTIFLSVFAAEFVFFLAERLGKRAKWAVISIISILMIITIPATIKQLQVKTATDPRNSFFYVNKDVIETYKQAEKLSNIKDTFLIIWPFNWSFPGISGRRVFHGHNLLTIDYDRKDKEVFEFFDGKWKKEEMEDYLHNNSINYILTYNWLESVKSLANIEKVFEKGTMAIYKVK